MADEEEQVPIGSTELAVAEPPAPAPATGPSGPAIPALPTMPDMNPLVEAHRRYMDESGTIRDATTVQLGRDRARAEAAFSATGIQPGELQAWDHERQTEKYRTDPLESFGSLGSIFAMVASAFTRAPMDNALNGAAAAMNAIREGNDKEFDRAYKAWQANTDLTMKRHQIQQQHYGNAVDMLKTNMAAGETLMRSAATRFGDEQMQFLLSNGLHKESIDLINSRAAAAERIRELQQNMTTDVWRNEVVKSSFARIDEAGLDRNVAAAHKLAIINNAYGKGGTPQQVAFGIYLAENQGKPFDEVLEGAQRRGLIPRAGGVVTRDRLGAEQIEARAAQYEKELTDGGMPAAQARTEAFRRAVKEVDIEMARMSGNRLDDLAGTSDRYNYAISGIDRVTDRIKRLWGPVGAYGYANRGLEIFGHLLGRENPAEYQQVVSDIALLKTWASENLTQRPGRPLAVEAANLNNIIQGLNVFDTTQNTLKTFEKMRELYSKMQADVERRRTGTRGAPSLGGGGGAERLPPPPTRPPAMSDGIPVD